MDRSAHITRVVLAWIACIQVVCITSNARAEDRCPTVFKGIERELSESTDPIVLRRLAPYAGVEVVKKLLARARASDDELGADLLIAVGASRHAEALRLLREMPVRAGKRLGRALALLALGDGSETGTITRGLIEGPVGDRRRAAKALSTMRQKRPRLMLYDALDDADDEVRQCAARSLFELEDGHARRVLLDLFRSGSAEAQKSAARALASFGYFFKTEELSLLSPPLRMAVVVADAAHGRRSSLKLLGAQLRSNDDATRAIAFAALALLGAESKAALKKLQGKPGETPPPEPTFALALLNEPQAQKALEGFDRAGASRAAAILWAFAAAGTQRSQLEADHAAGIARAIDGWIVRGLLNDDEVAHTIQAIERIEASAVLVLARTRLLGPEGRGLTSAIRAVGRNGSPNDLPDLIAVAPRVGSGTRAESWRAAARVCFRGR